VSPKGAVISALAVIAFLSGAADQYFYPNNPLPPTNIIASILGIVLIFVWYCLDSDQRSYRRSSWLNIGVFLFAIVALPYYFFRSRGIAGGVAATGIFLLMLVASGILTAAGTYATYYALQR
jgi:hypothetical protein